MPQDPVDPFTPTWCPCLQVNRPTRCPATPPNLETRLVPIPDWDNPWIHPDPEPKRPHHGLTVIDGG